MALCRLDVPGLVLYNGSIAPGTFRGRDITIQDVFEAVGAYAAGTDRRRRAARGRVGRVPRRRRLRRPVHGQHHVDGARLPRHQPGRPERHPGAQPGQGRRRRGVRPAGDAARARRRAPVAHHHPRVDRERGRVGGGRPAARPTACCTCSRSPHELGIPFSIDEFDAIAARTPIVASLKPGGAVRRDRPVRRRRRRAGRPRAAQARPRPRGRPQRRRAHARRDRRPGGRDARPAGGRADRDAAQGDAAASPSCAATSRRTAAWSSWPATSGCPTAAPRACSTARRTASPRSRPARSSPATWS